MLLSDDHIGRIAIDCSVGLGVTGVARHISRAAIAAAILAGLTVSACTSVESVRNSKESGFVHRFAAPFRQVLDAMPAALEAVKLRVAESTDTASGTRIIIARYPASALHLGYYVRITIKELNAGQTEVEVLSKKGQLADMPGNIGNSSDLFLEIGKRVYGT
jgi:hypothetical protein